MNISNVVLDRDRALVIYEARDRAGICQPINWVDDTGWLVTGYCEYEEELSSYLKGLHKAGASPMRLAEPMADSKPDNEPTPDYYNHEYKGLTLDPYRICKIYSVVNPCQQHAIKKLLRGLNKGDVETPLELIESVEGILARWKEMLKEDAE